MRSNRESVSVNLLSRAQMPPIFVDSLCLSSPSVIWELTLKLHEDDSDRLQGKSDSVLLYTIICVFPKVNMPVKDAKRQSRNEHNKCPKWKESQNKLEDNVHWKLKTSQKAKKKHMPCLWVSVRDKSGSDQLSSDIRVKTDNTGASVWTYTYTHTATVNVSAVTDGIIVIILQCGSEYIEFRK